MDKTRATIRFFDDIVQWVVNHSTEVTVPEQINDTLLETLIYKHRLEFFFLPYLRTHLPESPIRKKIEQRCLRGTHRYLRHKAHLLKLITQLDAQGIEYAVLKGIPLNNRLFGEQCMRVSGDIDVLIHPDNLAAAHQCVTQLGFELISPVPIETLLAEASLTKHALKDLFYKHQNDQVALELHWRATVIEEFGIGVLDKQKTQTINLGTQHPVKVLKPEYDLLYLCIHGAGHRWDRIQWLLDIAFYAKQVSFSWQTLIELAQARGITRPLLEAKLLLKRHFSDTLGEVPYSWQDWLVVQLRIWYMTRVWYRVKSPYRWVGYMMSFILYPTLISKARVFMRKLCLDRM